MEDFTSALRTYKALVNSSASPHERYKTALILETIRASVYTKISTMCKEHDIDYNKYRHDLCEGKKKRIGDIEFARQEFVKYGDILLKEDLSFVSNKVKEGLQAIMASMPDKFLADDDVTKAYFDGLLYQMKRIGIIDFEE